MKLIIMVINQDQDLEKVLEILAELGINNATVFHGEGIGHYLAYNMPIFAGLQRVVGLDKTAYNHTLFVIANDEQYLQLQKLLKEEGVDFSAPGIGIMVVLPINDFCAPDL